MRLHLLRLPAVRLLPGAVALRGLALLGVALVWLFGWAVLAQQNTLLWQRLPASSVDRFVADGVQTALPALPVGPQLLRACAEPPSFWARHRRAALREQLAHCLDQPTALVQGAAAEAAIGHYEGVLNSQVQAAQAWLAAYAVQADGISAERRAALAALQKSPAGRLAPLVDALPAALRHGPGATREAVGRTDTAGRTAQLLQDRLLATQARMQALASQPTPERLRGLALLASGLQLGHDYGQIPPQPMLGTDRGSLADTLEWVRRGQGFQARGFDLAQWHALPATLFASALVLMAVALVAGRARPLPWALWGLATLLLGAGALVLTDLALTGDPALRYLAERQYLRFGLGDSAVPLVWTLLLGEGQRQPLWLPLLAVAAALPVLGLLRHGQSWLLAPLRAWVRASDGFGHGAVPMLVLVLAGGLAVLFLGMPAAISEWLILLGAVGLATFLARQAPLASLGGGLHGLNIGVVVVALGLAIGGSVARGDLGHALVAVMLAASFLLLFGGVALRGVVALALVAGMAALALCLWQGQLTGPLAWLTEQLPPHAQDRMQAMFDRLHVSASDLARVRWLLDSAGLQGWGPGYVPWQGIAAARSQDGLPLQGPSDYVLALVGAMWGRLGGMALLAAALALFTGAAAVGLQTVLRAGMPPAVRLLAGVGGFGSCLMAFKLVLSLGGVAGVLPLTGLPVALLGYGPVTHLAALAYLALALGTAHLRPAQASRGVNLRDRPMPAGALRDRGRWLLLTWLLGLAVLIAVAVVRLGRDDQPGGQRHTAQARLQLAQAIGQALVSADSAPVAASSVGAVACPALRPAVQAWNQRLAAMQHPVRLQAEGASEVTAALRLDAERLLDQLQPVGERGCRSLARAVGQMLDTDFGRVVGRQSAASNPAVGRRLAAFERPRVVGARPLDYSTANAWWGLPGCVQFLEGDRGACSPSASVANPAEGLTDIWLQRELAPQLVAAARHPVGQRVVNGRTVATGPTLQLSLNPQLQQQAQLVADCFTGQVRGPACAPVLPADAGWQQRHFNSPGALRAGALGLVLLDVASGRVVAMAGAVSDCTLDHFLRTAEPDAQGRMPALRPGQRCAQLPDKRSAWLAQQHPALWMFPGGSSIKGLAVLAGIDAGLIAAGDDATWKAILAESHERLPVQRVALAAGTRYLDLLRRVGFDQPALDLVWGGVMGKGSPAPMQARWPAATFSGVQGLRAPRMGLDEAERIRAEKLAGVNVDQRYGRAVMAEFLAARQLADAALGGNDTRVSALGLAQLWRALDLRAGGLAQAPAVHLLEHASVQGELQDLGWASTLAARRVLAITSGVTAAAWKGTAQGSCRHVFGSCPAQGLPGVSGKTGSADFLLEEDSPFVKPGQQIPGKLYGGLFTAADGKRYAVAAAALRVREGDSRTLDLTSSPPAEAAFTLMRVLGVQGVPAGALGR